MAPLRKLKQSFASLASGQNVEQAVQKLADACTKDKTLAQQVAPEIISYPGAATQLQRALGSQDVYIRQQAFCLLHTLCGASKEFVAAIDMTESPGTMAAVIQELQPPETPTTSHSLCLIVATLSNLKRKAAQALAAAGVIVALVQLLRHPKTQEFTAYLIAQSLFLIMYASTNRSREVASKGGIVPLAHLSHSQDAGIQSEAVHCLLCIFRTSPSYLPELSINEAIAALVRLVVHGKDEEYKRFPEISIKGTAAETLVLLSTIEHEDDADGTPQGHWESVVATALAHANAGHALLAIGKASSILLLTHLVGVNPGFVVEMAASGGLQRLKQLALSSQQKVSFTASSLLKALGAVPDLPAEYKRIINDGVDVERIAVQRVGEFAEFLRAGRMPLSCAKCGSMDGEGGVKLAMCSACREVAYCSAGCQKAHWKEHKPKCLKL